MKLLDAVLDTCRNAVRRFMRQVARGLNRLTGGRLHPDTVTLIGLAAHIPIAYLIATHHFVWAAGLLLVFGLFDTLDGELARLQGRASSTGMLLDASTDRMKEVMLYCGAAYAFLYGAHPNGAVWAVAACGASLCVSYVKAKGETAISKSLPPNEINRLLQDGLLRFEVRMAILIVGLLTGTLYWAVIIITVLASFTAVQRLYLIRRRLLDVQS